MARYISVRRPLCWQQHDNIWSSNPIRPVIDAQPYDGQENPNDEEYYQ